MVRGNRSLPLPEHRPLLGGLLLDPLGALVGRQDEERQVRPAMLLEELGDREDLDPPVVVTGQAFAPPRAARSSHRRAGFGLSKP